MIGTEPPEDAPLSAFCSLLVPKTSSSSKAVVGSVGVVFVLQVVVWLDSGQDNGLFGSRDTGQTDRQAGSSPDDRTECAGRIRDMR